MTLLRLTVENVGLIVRAELDFAAGLTVVTGETGSGKTMLLGGLELALGGRADTETVRRGAERARATLEVAPDAGLRARLADAGFELADDDDLIVQREVLASGRSQGRINGAPASASQLRDLAGTLVDVVSQHEAQRLLAPAYALDLVDRSGGAEALALRDDVRRLHDETRAARERVAALRDDDGRKLARAEFARFALGEIDAAAIDDDGEDERLRERRDVLTNAERILASLATASAALEDEAAAVDALGAVETALLGLARYGERFAELAGAAAALQSDANELAARIARERDAVELDPAELEAVGARLDALDSLKKKYGGTLAAVRAQREAFAGEIADVDDRDARVAAAQREADALERALHDRANALERPARAVGRGDRSRRGRGAARARHARGAAAHRNGTARGGRRARGRARRAAVRREPRRAGARPRAGSVGRRAVTRAARARRRAGRPPRAHRAGVRRDRRGHRRRDGLSRRRTPGTAGSQRAGRVRDAPRADRVVR